MTDQPARLVWADRARLDEDTEAGFLGPGAPFELARQDVLGVEIETFVNAPGSVAEMASAARNHGDKPFLIDDTRDVTFASLSDAVAARAGALAELGVGAGDRVLLAGAPSIEHAITALAVSWLGAVLAPVNPRSTAHELEHYVAVTEPVAAVVDDDVRSTLPDGLPARTFSLVAESKAAPVAEPAEIDRDDPAVIIFTSGTTGRPRGATLTHRSVAHFCFSAAVTILVKRLVGPPDGAGGGAPPVAIACSPMFHVSGLLGQLLNALAWGSTLVYLPLGRWDPVVHLDRSARHRVTMWSLVPTQLQRLIDHEDLGEYDLSALESVGGGGAVFAPELMRRTAGRLPNARLQMRIGYGMTESAGLLTMLVPPYSEAELASVGRPVAGCEIEIRDENGTLVEEGVVGEIWGRTAGLFQGYWGDPAATAEVFDEDRWYRTGDYGRVEDDNLYLESRLRDMIIRGGENIYPIEIENRLCEHPAVVDAAVIGVDHPDLGQEVKAVIELRDGESTTADELQAWCAETLARYKVPAQVVFQTLPRNDVGKVLKRDLG